jgi:hypothetical protein
MLSKFKTKKALKEHFQNLIHKIGLCESILKEHSEHYDEFIELFERHPKYDEKCKNIKDIMIRKNPVYNNLELIMKKEDDSTDDISYLMCVNGKGKNDLKTAMREAIQPQINDFKMKSKLICELCNSTISIHIDHHSDFTPFEKLYIDFMKINNLPIPTTFNSNKAHINCFKDEDKEFSKNWYEYHRLNVILRVLCKKCNLSQPKYKWTKSDILYNYKTILQNPDVVDKINEMFDNLEY